MGVGAPVGRRPQDRLPVHQRPLRNGRQQARLAGGFRWTDVHADLRFQGRTGMLRKNYRSTREIGEAAQDYLQAGALDEQVIERSYAQTGGPLPAV